TSRYRQSGRGGILLWREEISWHGATDNQNAFDTDGIETEGIKRGDRNDEKNRSWQLLYCQLSAVLAMDGRRPGRCPRSFECPATACAAGVVPPHSVLPQAMQVLLLPRLHR